MARYIDADKLSKEVLASWDKDNHRTLEASQVHRQEHCHLMRIIEKQPIADVVPKSEVKCIYAYDGEVEEYCVQSPCPNYKTIEQAKQEVAREIFEEIEKCAYYHPQLREYIILEKHYTELKKKYTKESEGNI